MALTASDKDRLSFILAKLKSNEDKREIVRWIDGNFWCDDAAAHAKFAKGDYMTTDLVNYVKTYWQLSLLQDAFEITGLSQSCITELQDIRLSRPGRTRTRTDGIRRCREIFQHMIYDKQTTPYDFLRKLQLFRFKGIYTRPLDLNNSDGLTLAHMCVEQKHWTLLPIFVYMGWWSLLRQQKVPKDSASLEHRGKTVDDIATSSTTRCKIAAINNLEDSLSDLMKAVRINDTQRIDILLESGVDAVDINYRDSNNTNVLFWAIVAGNVDVFNKCCAFVKHEALSNDNETLLHSACAVGATRFIPVLLKLKHPVIYPCHLDVHKKTALQRAAGYGDLKTLKSFLACGLQPNEECLTWAAYNGRTSLVKYCLQSTEMRMDVNSCDMYDRTPLLRACNRGHYDLANYLLMNGADPTMTTKIGTNVLHETAESGNTKIFDILLPHLQQSNILDAMINHRHKFHGNDLCFILRGRDRGRDAYHYVEVKRHLKPLFLKKTKNGNVDVKDFGKVIKSGWGINPEDEVRQFIEELYKTRRQNSAKDAQVDATPLHVAAFYGNTEFAKLLLQNGADVDKQDIFGNTALMIAASKDNLEFVKALEQYGSNFDEVNKDDMDAADIAKLSECDRVLHYITGREFVSSSLSEATFSEFRNKHVPEFARKIDRDTLSAIHKEGHDIRSCLIQTVRDFQLQCTELLRYLDSGPIVQDIL